MCFEPQQNDIMSKFFSWNFVQLIMCYRETFLRFFFRHSKLAWKKINLKILGLMCYQQKWPRLLIFFPLFHLVNKKLNSGSELEILNLLVVINELQSFWHSYLNPVLRRSWIVLKFVLQQTSVWHWIYSSEILFGIFRA